MHKSEYSIEDLRVEFDKRFTIMGAGKVLDEIGSPDDLWNWICENFDPKINDD